MTNTLLVLGHAARLRRWQVHTPMVYTEHTHAHSSFEVVLAGRYVEAVQGQAMHRQASGGYLVAANVPHACCYHGAVHSLSLEFLREKDNQLLQSHRIVQLSSAQLGPAASTVFRGLVNESCQPDALSALAIDAYCAELLVAALRNGGDKLPSSNSTWMHKVVERLNEPCQTPVSVQELARLVKLHPGHLAKLFRAEFGVPVATYQRRQRLHQASLDVIRGLPLVEVALAAGYSAQSQFSTAFKKAFAMSPGQFRRMHAGR